MTGKLRDLTINRDRTQNITITVGADFRPRFDELYGKELDIEIKPHREKRSLSANAYLHVLINRIAEKMNLSDDEVKASLVTNYGVIARDEDGAKVAAKLPASVDIDGYYPYTRCYKTVEENGKLYKCYLLYKRTRVMDSKEISRVIDGAIYEAKNLGLETDTPEQIARLKAEWEAYEQQHKVLSGGQQPA